MSTCAFACTSTAARGSVGDITRLILSPVVWWLHNLKVFILRWLFVQAAVGAERSDEGWKNPTGFHIFLLIYFFSGVICFALMWIQKSANSEVTALDTVLLFNDGTRKLLHLDFRTPSHTCVWQHNPGRPVFKHTDLQAAVKRTISFYSYSHSPVGASLRSTWFWALNSEVHPSKPS